MFGDFQGASWRCRSDGKLTGIWQGIWGCGYNSSELAKLILNPKSRHHTENHPSAKAPGLGNFSCPMYRMI
ncbi:hypothetical protein DV515_00018899 [Chloebia gouldiae]|uniref:Uncharacterized protein n=1 Tax=Chloebia gouldiae TaxID=44316 RepID=A0A3L8Q680_CHLGU|nr:hypothetical protein DV515_00018899 [Chloebia gouldiae]